MCPAGHVRLLPLPLLSFAAAAAAAVAAATAALRSSVGGGCVCPAGHVRLLPLPLLSFTAAAAAAAVTAAAAALRSSVGGRVRVPSGPRPPSTSAAAVACFCWSLVSFFLPCGCAFRWCWLVVFASVVLGHAAAAVAADAAALRSSVGGGCVCPAGHVRLLPLPLLSFAAAAAAAVTAAAAALRSSVGGGCVCPAGHVRPLPLLLLSLALFWSLVSFFLFCGCAFRWCWLVVFCVCCPWSCCRCWCRGCCCSKVLGRGRVRVPCGPRPPPTAAPSVVCCCCCCCCWCCCCCCRGYCCSKVLGGGRVRVPSGPRPPPSAAAVVVFLCCLLVCCALLSSLWLVLALPLPLWRPVILALLRLMLSGPDGL